MSSIPLNNTPFPLRTLPKVPETSILDITLESGPLDASKDTRQIVMLAQCPQCSYPLQEPVTLPCGNTICKKCIPALHLRQNISYPATPNRLQGFKCPFGDCGIEHAMGDCSVDVVLNKITGIVKQEIERYRNTPDASEVLLQIEKQDKWAIAGISSLRDQEVRSRVLAGGRLVSTYTMAEMGELPYDSEVSITATVPISEKAEALDTAVLEHLKDATRAELECQVCYALFLDPFTTSCGHTFCRKCIGRVRDHSNLCPVCRRTLAMPSGEKAKQSPSNILICRLLTGLCPEALALRVAMDKEAEKHEDLELDTPIFVCTLSFPSIPTFLHIFEPRYRLMIRRALESGDRKFGMVLHNPTRQPQGALGPVAYHQYGTMLEIINMQLLPDGRSVIETVGVSRFRVLKDGELDNYKVSKIERIEDMSIGDEEELEVRETSSSPKPRIFSAQDDFGAPPQHLTAAKEPLRPEDINSMPTRELFEIGVAFVKKMREQSAPWLHHRVFQAYGECPTDPALFPWWLASVLPIVDAEKYKLLPTASVRERLKMCVGWISGIESQRCGSSSSCTVL